MQTLNYANNICNWLTNINDVSALGNDMFAMQLGYTTGGYPQFNGNIATMQWATELYGPNTYNFNYDGANRITEADFSGTGQHSTSYSYDKNGNIETLTRKGRYGGSIYYGDIDDLTYTYQGNQLQSVNDVNDGYGPHQASGFSDHGSFATTEYQYDANGNMMADSNKSIDTIHYNHLNLPDQIDITTTSATQEINYLYSATGQKLRKATRINSTPANTTDYVGSFIYENGLLQSILTPEGRVVVDGSNYEYQFFLKDHLGNTRITFNQSGTIIQEDSYYPFGMAMAGLSHETGEDLPNKYLYNGKELQDDFGLDWYDYGARMYDPTIGRWYVQDAVAESYYSWSPYNYTMNNPIKFIDPNGMFVDNYEINSKGEIRVERTDDKTDTYTYKDKDGEKHDLGTYKKNEKGLIGLKGSIEQNSENVNFKISVKNGQEDQSYISGEALASLFGVAIETGFRDITINRVSNPDGSSPKGSATHENGNYIDFRYFSTDKSGKATYIFSPNFDSNRQNTFNSALKKYGWKSLVSQHSTNWGVEGMIKKIHVLQGTSTVENHWHHLHTQTFRPNIREVFNLPKLTPRTITNL